MRSPSKLLQPPPSPPGGLLTFSLHNIPPESHIKVTKEMDHQQKNLVIVKQVLLVRNLGNVYRTVWRICILMLGRTGSMIVVVILHEFTESVTSGSCYVPLGLCHISH